MYRVTSWTGAVRPADDVSEARWFSRRALPYREIAFAGLRRLLRAWAGARRPTGR
ncbi:MAG: hypothetical protein HYS77_17285 [Candidatus Rokubacteria bacterium]|nr:hypothetical protein [Candidatus Rokubacteria bacterium]